MFDNKKRIKALETRVEALEQRVKELLLKTTEQNA